ncbi:MAG: TonB-dependent receptor [Bacteroidales bacterium]|nr:TonB-dependent receptor [Bacteroidales bacterium]
MKKFFYLLLFIFGFFLTNAQNPDSLDNLWNMSLEDLMDYQVSGVSRFTQNIDDISNSIQVITQQQISDRGYHDLGDVLKDLNDFDVVSNAGQFGEFYCVRGIEGNDRFLVLINGHKINPSSGTYLSIGNSISVRYAERIEIIYGAASAVYGADAFSGIINIVINQDNLQTNNISGSINYGALYSADANFKAEAYSKNGFSVFLLARYYQSNGPNFTNTDSTFYNYNVVKNYPLPLINSFEQPTNDHTIYFSAAYKNFSVNYFRKQFDEGNALGFVPSIYIYNKENKWKNSTDMVWIVYKQNFKNSGVFTVDLSYKYHNQDKNTLYYKWNVPNVFDPAQRYRQFMTGKDNTYLALFTYNQNISKKITFVLGADNEYFEMIPPYANDEIFGESVKYFDENEEIIDDKLTIYENRSSVFGQFFYNPFEFMNFAIGGRYDYSSRYGGVFNPRIGVIISPFSSTKIKVNYGKSFQAPSLFFQYEQWGAPTVVNISASEMQKIDPNWELQNQIITSQEFSLHQLIGNNLKFVFTIYYNKLSNVIERNVFSDSVYNKYFDSYTVGLRNENIGKQEILGGNFQFNAKLSRKLTVYSYYSYTDAVSLTGGETNSIPRVSLHKVWAGFTFQNLFDHVTFSGRMKWVSSMFNMNNVVFPDNTQPGYYLLDANISYNNLGEYFRIYANFENVLNTFIEHGGLYEQSGVYTAVIPQQGFTFKVGLEFMFGK